MSLECSLARTRMIGSCLAMAIALLVFASGAHAGGKVVDVGAPLQSGRPAVAVDGSGNALIAWANTKDLEGTNNFVQYCVLPVGAGACSHSGSLIPSDSAAYTDGVQVLVEGTTLIVLADVYGTVGSGPRHHEPEQEWQSTDGGATWQLVDGGLSVTDGIVNADTGPLSAVTLPGTGFLGYGWNTAAGSPTFNAFPVVSPPECSRASCPATFATLEPPSNPDRVGNLGGQFASELGPTPGVLGIFATNSGQGPLQCSKGLGTAYAYGSGAQSATNDYNQSPGQPNSAWRVAVTHADCNVSYPAVDGGPSGLGVLETNNLTNQTVYHRFNQTTETFSAPMATVNPGTEQDPAVSQDGAGGVYGTYLKGGVGGPIELSYSHDGGDTWTSAPLNPNRGGGASDVTSAVNGAGQGWATWADNGSVFAQSFQATDAIVAARIGRRGKAMRTTVTIHVSCSSLPCTVTVVLTAPETVVGHAHRARKHHKTINVTLGKGKLRITRKGRHDLTVHLSGKGRSYVRSHSGHFKVTAKVSQTVQHHSVTSSHTIKVNTK